MTRRNPPQTVIIPVMKHEPHELWDAAPPQFNREILAHPLLHMLMWLVPLMCLLILAIVIIFTVWHDGALARFQAAGLTVGKSTDKTSFVKAMNNKDKSFEFLVQHPDKKTYKYSLREAGIQLDAVQTYATGIKKQKEASLLSKLKFWQTTQIPISLKIDDHALHAFIQDKMTITTTEAVNATIDTSTGTLVVTEAMDGIGYAVKDASQQLQMAAALLKPVTLTLAKQPLKPSVTTNDLLPITKDIEKITNTPVTLTISGRSYSPSPEEIIKWIEPITSEADKAVLEINSGRIQEYIEKISSPYTRDVRAEIQMRDEDGTITTLVAGKNGTGVNNQAEAAKIIASNLRTFQPTEQELTIGVKPFTVTTANDYDKWIHVDVTEKWMYAYEKDKLVRAVPISAGAPATPTVIGQFKIYRKLPTRDMRGQNADGTNYFQPNVAWVSYFYKGYAIHGNYWRPASWFGRVNSSHGCVSAQNNVIKWFYDWAPVGTPVITHY